MTTTTNRRVCWLYGIAAIFSTAVFVVFWCTNVFRDTILSNLELRNETDSFRLWQHPPGGLNLKVYVFNYTNVKEFESGKATKLKVQEVGPYVYRETLSRQNVVVNENDTVTYQENRTYRWISGKDDNETVVVPNVLLLSALAYSRNLYYVFQLSLTVLLSNMRSKPFLELPVGKYLWGYDDQLFEVAKTLPSLRQSMSYDKFGILAMRNGLNPDRITMHTGTDNLRNLGLIQSINGKKNSEVWRDETCDRIYGTDGSMFPPDWIRRPNSTLYVYAKDVCREMEFHYAGRGFSNGIPTLRYELPSNAFTSTPNKDSCFCPKESYDSIDRRCPPAGIFNISACKQGTPLLVSLPHFYTGDKSLFEKIDGLKPRAEHYESYIDLHPRLSIAVGIKTKIQLNVEVRKAVGMPFSGNLEDGMILPLVWIDTEMDDLPDSVQQLFYNSHYLVNAIEAGFQWCSLIATIVLFSAFVVARRKDYEKSSMIELSDSSGSDQQMEDESDFEKQSLSSYIESKGFFSSIAFQFLRLINGLRNIHAPKIRNFRSPENT